MRTEHRQVPGDLLVSDHLSLRGQVCGDITVAAGGRLELHGMCGGNLIVEAGATARVHGMVCGDVLDRGGELTVTGLVGGATHRRPA